jgi:hypothetical protein
LDVIRRFVKGIIIKSDMVQYSISEKPLRYKVLLYSENPELINSLNKKLESENIDLIAKHLKSEEDIKTGNETIKKNYLKIICDVSLKDVDCKRIISETNKLTCNLIIIFKGSEVNVSKIRNSRNIIIFIDDFSKDLIERTTEYIKKHLTNDRAEVVKFTKKNKTKNRFKNKFFAATLLTVILFSPYLICFFLYLNALVMSSNPFERLSLRIVELILLKDVNAKKNIYKYDQYYTALPMIGPLYENAAQFSEEVYNESTARLHIISKVRNFNSSIEKLAIGDLIKDGVDPEIPEGDFGNIDIADKNKLKLYFQVEEALNEARRLYDVVFNNSKIKGNKYFAVVVQNNKKLTPTGGGLEEVAIFSAVNGKINLVNKLSAKELLGRFKGRANDVITLNNTGNFNFIESALDIKYKYKIISIILQELYQQNVSGIITIEDSEREEINEIKDLAVKDDLSLKDSASLYEKVNKILDNGNIIYYFINDNSNVHNNYHISENQKHLKDKCFDNYLSFMELSDNTNAFKAGEVKLSGEYSKGLLSIGVSYSNQNSVGSYSFMIKWPNGWNLSSSAGGNITQEKVYTDSGIFLITKIVNKTVDESIAQFKIPLDGCANGFGLSIVKQPGNNLINLVYEINTSVPLYLYIDSSLTGRGNRFYNNGLLYLNKNITFEFVK